MKAADLAVLILCLAMAGGGFAAFYYWQAEEARKEEAAYEAALDAVIDRKIESVELDEVLAALGAQTEGRLEALQALYVDPERNDRINLGFATLRGDFPASYELIAEAHGRETEQGRFQRELDERFGDGTYQLMSTNYEQFLADAPRRAAEREAEARRRDEMLMRALRDFQRRNGRLPDSGARMENGQFVEP